jgi:hypothetical protein
VFSAGGDAIRAQGAAAGRELRLGVIDDARHRQRSRRRRRAWLAALAVATVGLLAGALDVIALGPGESGRAARTPARWSASSAVSGSPVDVRMWPALTVGRAGWCYAVEGAVGGGGAWGCGVAQAAGEPFVTVFGWGRTSAAMTVVAVTAPDVRSVSFGGGARIPTAAHAGLPYGFRAASEVTAAPSRPVAFDSEGRVLPSTPRYPQAAQPTRSWSYPASAPAGYCNIRAAGLPPTAARAGAVMTSLRAPVPGPAASLLACASTEFTLGGTQMQAVVLIGAAGAARLPNFHAVAGMPGVLTDHGRSRAHGALAAKRAGRGWIVVSGGRDQSDRVALLGKLSATIAGT